MHTVLVRIKINHIIRKILKILIGLQDILAGLALAIILMFPLVPCVNYLDNYFLTNPMSPILILMSSILMIVYYPNSEKWTPTRYIHT